MICNVSALTERYTDNNRSEALYRENRFTIGLAFALQLTGCELMKLLKKTPVAGWKYWGTVVVKNKMI